MNLLKKLNKPCKLQLPSMLSDRDILVIEIFKFKVDNLRDLSFACRETATTPPSDKWPKEHEAIEIMN